MVVCIYYVSTCLVSIVLIGTFARVNDLVQNGCAPKFIEERLFYEAARKTPEGHASLQTIHKMLREVIPVAIYSEDDHGADDNHDGAVPNNDVEEVPDDDGGVSAEADGGVGAKDVDLRMVDYDDGADGAENDESHKAPWRQPRALPAPTPATEGETYEQIPDWAKQLLPFDPKMWWEILDSFGIDDIARKTLYLLGGMCEEGAYEANLIIGKLLNVGHTKENPSGFVHKCACNARVAITRKYPSAADDRYASSSSSQGKRQRWS